jgi:hypothetical protein
LKELFLCHRHYCGRFAKSNPHNRGVLWNRKGLPEHYSRVLIFLTGTAQAAREPKQTELIFDRFGDQYFLSEIFEEGNHVGVELPESRPSGA